MRTKRKLAAAVAAIETLLVGVTPVVPSRAAGGYQRGG
jgi:hypothetical protein